MRTLSIARIERQIVKCQEAFKKAVGFRPGLLRPPYGAFNRPVVETAQKHGLETVTWTISGEDWSPKATPESIKKGIIDGAGNGVIYLLHDVKPKVTDALPTILGAIKAKGYATQTACEMLGVKAVIG